MTDRADDAVLLDQLLRRNVTDQITIGAAAVGYIRDMFDRLDVLVNHVSIAQAGQPDRSFEKVVWMGCLSVASIEKLKSVFETNVFGIITVM